METMNESTIGNKYRVMPSFTYGKDPGKSNTGKRLTGTVVYVHPNGRYAVLEFKTKSGEKLRECFWSEELHI